MIKEAPQITRSDLRRDASKPYLAVIVECDGVEYQRNFAPETTEDEILTDWCIDKRHWHMI